MNANNVRTHEYTTHTIKLHSHEYRLNTHTNILPTFMEYTCLLLTDFKNEFRLYIAYIGTKGTKEK